MHSKNIKKLVNKQLKSKHPNWNMLTKKEKTHLSKAVVDEILQEYDYSQALDLPIEELTGIDNQKPLAGIRSLQLGYQVFMEEPIKSPQRLLCQEH